MPAGGEVPGDLKSVKRASASVRKSVGEVLINQSAVDSQSKFVFANLPRSETTISLRLSSRATNPCVYDAMRALCSKKRRQVL